jgi:tetratricopeptide (TPR) repeat protein
MMKPNLFILGFAIGTACACQVYSAVAGEPKTAAAQAAVDPATVVRIQGQVDSLRGRLNALRIEESQLQIAAMKAEWAAAQGLDHADQAAEKLAKGETAPELQRYRATVLRNAQEWQVFRNRFIRLAGALKPLERQRDALPGELQAEIDGLSARVSAKDRTLLLRMANLYEKVAEYRAAWAICASVYQDIPEDRRIGERALKEKMASLAEKCGDYRAAATLLKSILDVRPEKDRYNDRKLGERLGDLYVKSGAPREALDLYRRLYAAMPQQEREKNGAGLHDKIAAIEQKLGASHAPARSQKNDHRS